MWVNQRFVQVQHQHLATNHTCRWNVINWCEGNKQENKSTKHDEKCPINWLNRCRVSGLNVAISYRTVWWDSCRRTCLRNTKQMHWHTFDSHMYTPVNATHIIVQRLAPEWWTNDIVGNGKLVRNYWTTIFGFIGLKWFISFIKMPKQQKTTDSSRRKNSIIKFI